MYYYEMYCALVDSAQYVYGMVLVLPTTYSMYTVCRLDCNPIQKEV